MIKIKIYGILAKDLGFKELESEISCTAEVFRQFDNILGFPSAKKIMEYRDKGIYYVFIVKSPEGKVKIFNKPTDEIKEEDEVFCYPANVLNFEPVSAAAAGTILFQVGSVAVTTTALATTAIMLAISVGLSLLANLLAPKPPNPIGSEAAKRKESYLFDGRARTVNQGSTVPLGYGRMMVPGSVIYNRVEYVTIGNK